MVETENVKFTLQDAFNYVIHDLNYYREQDKRGKDRIRNYRRFLKAGTITKDQMEKVIKDYGIGMSPVGKSALTRIGRKSWAILRARGNSILIGGRKNKIIKL